jgi:Flp pilus assembly protein TadD
LLRLADEWIAADPSDADAWFARGLASARLSQPGGAAAALEHTLALAPRNAEAWYEFGAASAVSGDSAAVRRALDALTVLHPGFAQRLAGSVPERLPAAPPPNGCAECGERAR